jgi:hypothetical protein
VTCLQVYIYFQEYMLRDGFYMKLFVFVVWCVPGANHLVITSMFIDRLIDTANVVMVAYTIYYYVVIGFGNYDIISYVRCVTFHKASR